MLVIADYTIEEVLPFVNTEFENSREYIIDGKPYTIRLSSARLNLFKKSQTCVSCGIVGTVMRLESARTEDNPHFNLYSKDNGEFVLMTKDHIHPRGKGGSDHIDNLQTMCCVCNNLKAHYHLEPADILQARQFKRERTGKVTRPELNRQVHEFILKMQKKPLPHVSKAKKRVQSHGDAARKKAQLEILWTSVALNVVMIKDELNAVSSFIKTEEPVLHVIPGRQAVRPIGHHKSSVVIKMPQLGQSRYCLINQNQLKEELEV